MTWPLARTIGIARTIGSCHLYGPPWLRSFPPTESTRGQQAHPSAAVLAEPYALASFTDMSGCNNTASSSHRPWQPPHRHLRERPLARGRRRPSAHVTRPPAGCSRQPPSTTLPLGHDRALSPATVRSSTPSRACASLSVTTGSRTSPYSTRTGPSAASIERLPDPSCMFYAIPHKLPSGSPLHGPLVAGRGVVGR